MKNFNFKTGFTIVEMLVAISILVIGVLGPLGVASRGISDGIYAKNQIAATYLAQEAMEVVINTRNSNLLLHRDWLTGLVDTNDNSDSFSAVPPNDCSDGDGCYVDSFLQDTVSDGDNNSGLIANSSGSGDTNRDLQFCSGGNLNRYVTNPTAPASCTNLGGTLSGPVFTRAVLVEQVVVDEQIKVTVTVDWLNKNVSKNITLVQHLFHLDEGNEN